MFCIVLEFAKGSGSKDPKNVHWVAVHSFFEYLFPDEIVCVLKPYNKNDGQAKVFFRQKVLIPDGSSQVEINNFLASIVDCHEEENLSATRTRVLPLPACPGNLDRIASELSTRYKTRVTCLPDSDSDNEAAVILSVTGCHEEVLDAALETIDRLLKSKTSGATVPAVAVTGTSDKPPVSTAVLAPTPATAPAAATQRSRKPLFSPEVIATADAAREAEEATNRLQQQQQPTQQPVRQESQSAPAQSQPGVFHLSPACRLKIRRCDLTLISETEVDLLVASTNGALSLRFGLAKALANRWGFDTIESECQHHLRSVRGGQIPFGGSFLSQAGQILFVVLPNDRKLEGQLGRGREFRRAVDRCLDDTMQQLVRLAGDKNNSGYRRVAMPTLGSTLPLWGEDSRDEWAEALAGALARLAGGPRGAGQLSELSVCCVSDEAARLLSDAVAKQLNGVAGATGSSRGSGGGEKSGVAASGRPAAENMDVDDDSTTATASAGFAADSSCLLCANEFSAKNPPTPFHCQKPGNELMLCGICVARLNDTSQPSDGKCVICFERYRPAQGNQPAGGRMKVTTETESLPGHEDCGTIVINYEIESGTHEGIAYKSVYRTAYLPHSSEGQKLLQRLKAAFAGRVIFSIGASATTGRQVAVTWNTVHHKTNKTGGSSRHGYPDAEYLQRTSEELSALGY